MFLDWLIVVWLVYFPFAVAMLAMIVWNRTKYQRRVSPLKVFNSPKIVFRIVTKQCPELVEENVAYIHDCCSKVGFLNYSVEVVTDAQNIKVQGADVTSVPIGYYGKAKYKARALQYALEHTVNRIDTWIYHLDEESQVTTQAIRAVLEYIEAPEAKPIAEGPINYPLDTRNLITFFLEGERAVGCYSCVSQMVHTPIWLHGSNLLVRSDVEHAVGWQYGDILAEDQRFAYVADKLGYKFGWHGGLILEKPAFTYRDAVKQRKRWFIGSLQNLAVETRRKQALSVYMLGSWFTGFFAAVLFPLVWLGVVGVPWWANIIMIFCLFVWLNQYQIGLGLNLRHQHPSLKRELGLHTLLLFASPIVGLLGCLPVVLCLYSRPKNFEIVQKY